MLLRPALFLPVPFSLSLNPGATCSLRPFPDTVPVRGTVNRRRKTGSFVLDDVGRSIMRQSMRFRSKFVAIRATAWPTYIPRVRYRI